ncbi:MAG TPA: tetratricopeptide repeat protein [Vicinamibacteria bacterium]|jgi:tetratricopeptide (TPR) repeat protein
MSAVVAAWVLASSAMAIQSPRADPAADALRYGAVVQQYLRGDGDEAIREVLTWNRGALSEAVGFVEEDESGKEGLPQTRAVVAAFPAAVMLHTEAALYLNEKDDDEGAGAHWGYARRLAELPPRTKPQEAFLRAWYHAVGLFCLGSFGVDNAIVFLQRGLQRFPDDRPIALALGQAYEARGTYRNGRVPSVQPNLSSDAKKDLRTAESFYRELLSQDPQLWEARLRIGRCAWLGGRPEAALAEFQRTGSEADDARLRYLAHLFTGDLYRRQSLVPEARQEFARAVELWPDGQTAALGLAEALHTLGERTEAGAALQAAIVERAGTPRLDPYHVYHFGYRAEQRRLLEAVRDLARASSNR